MFTVKKKIGNDGTTWLRNFWNIVNSKGQIFNKEKFIFHSLE